MSNEEKASRTAMAARLRMAREAAGLSQGQAAKLMGMHRPTVSEIEAGRRRLTAEEMVKFAKIYGIGVGWLFSKYVGCVDVVSVLMKTAAKQLSGLDDEDLDKLMRLFQSMRHR